MSMTRKDYKAIAEILSQYRPDAPNLVDNIAKELSYYLQADNSAFKREKFLTACKETEHGPH